MLILPESQRAFDYAAPLARKAGTVCIVSFPVGGFNISSQEVVFRDVRIKGRIPWYPLEDTIFLYFGIVLGFS